jgi:hypothetical protein
MTTSAGDRQFTAYDMERWARYLTDGKVSDLTIRNRLDAWFEGPERNRQGILWPPMHQAGKGKTV